MMASSSSSMSNGGSVRTVNSSNPGGNKIERAHHMYRDGKYEEALGFYTEALSAAKTVPQKIALHSNRAACFLKLHDFKKAAEECSWVLELDHDHTGALMLRAQTLVTLKEYSSALFDVNRLLELNPSSQVYQNLHARLKTQLSLAPIPEDDGELEEEEEDDDDLMERETNAGQELEHEYRGKQAVEAVAPSEHNTEMSEIKSADGKLSEEDPNGWRAIPKPKGHSQLDYSRWDRVVDDESSEDESSDDDDDDDSQPQYRFRVKTVGVRAVK